MSAFFLLKKCVALCELTIYRKMKNCVVLNVLLLLLCVSSVNAEIRITEVMPSNVATIYSDKYDYDGFVEFYNDGGSVDLKGWSVTNIKEGVTDWSAKLDSTHILPNGYSLLFFGKSETGSKTAAKVQSNYVGRVGKKLTPDEGSIIFEKDGKKIALDYPAQRPHLSYCEEGYMIPTPGKENNALKTTLANRVAAPTFQSTLPGIYEESQQVELACETEGAQIYYTINGDIPTIEDGIRYNGAIDIDSTTSLRARAFKEDMLFSEITTGSYILPDKFHNACKGYGDKLPIVCLTANDRDIKSNLLGIYVEGTNGSTKGCYNVPYNFQQDWIRSANFEYILDGKVVDNQEVEIGVYGGCTRIHVAKSLKIKANKRSGKNKLNYTNFFEDRSYKKLKSLALRNGGNGYSYVQPRFRDMFIQSLGNGMNLDKQCAQPVCYYLNGKYYGMMILTERTDEDFIYHNYGIDEEDIDLLSVNAAGYHVEVGTRDAYDEMINYASKNYSKADFYEEMDKRMDIDEYVDYQIIEQYVGNTDWVSNNTKLWRNRDGGRFRWILYDTDFGLSRATALDTNMIKLATSGKGTEPCWTLLKSCLKNEDFRWKFLDQYLDRLENQFTDESIDAKVDSLSEMTRSEMCATIKNSGFLGCPGNFTTYEQEIEKMRVFAKERKAYVIAQLKKEFGLGDDTVAIKIRNVFPNDETPEYAFLLNKREFKEVKYNGQVLKKERMKIEPIVPYGYMISRWEINNKMVKNEDGTKYMEKYLTTVADSTEWKVSIYFEYDSDCKLPANLCLNEVCASNASTLDENGEASDWIELFNGDDEDVDLAGMVVENETKMVRCTIPSGSVETILPAHGYKLLWADKNPELGPLHLNFKLGVSAPEEVSLRSYYRDVERELSRITYTPHATDESYGRETDGAMSMTLFEKCTDDKGDEIMTSTPLASNGSVECSSSVGVERHLADYGCAQVFVQNRSIYVQNAQGSFARIYSLQGDLIANERLDAELSAIDVPATGIYLVKVEKQCWKVVVE